jgi:hypothetical protein
VDDGEQIRGLLHEYCERMDAGDWTGVGTLFADGALADGHGNELARGAEAVAAFYRSGTQLHGGSPRTKHLVVGTALGAPTAGGVVVARSSYLVLQALDGMALQPIITGRYLDSFARGGDDCWRFAERRFFVDLPGDLSQHLTYAL